MAKGIAHRDWTIQRNDYDTDRDFTEAIQSEMALAQHIMERLGVAIVAAPVRKRSPFGGFYTEAVIFRTATVPAAREVENVSEVDALEDALEDGTLVGDPDPLAVE